jgi:tetratricopeptide (TPR) repeat protein
VNVKHGPDAEEALGKALTLQKQLVKEFPGQVEYQHDLGMSHFRLGWILLRAGRFEPAEKEMGQAIAIREKLAKENKVPLYQQELGMSLGNLGWLLTDTRRFQEAEPVLRRNLKLRQKLVEDYPDSPQARHYLADGYMDIARLERETGRLQEAEQDFRQELTLREKLVGRVSRCERVWESPVQGTAQPGWHILPAEPIRGSPRCRARRR